MKILKEQNGAQIRLECIGKLDAVSAPAFREEVSKTDLSQYDKVVLDFENVPYISSAGLRELLIVRKKLRPGVPLQIENASKEVDDIFEMTGFTDLLAVARPDTAAEYSGMSFGAFLSYKAENSGGKAILQYAGREYTWADVDRVASVIAEELYKLGVRKGAHVALCGANSANWVFTFYAIQKLGAIALLLNSQLTEAELVKFSNIGDIKYFCYGEMPSLPDMPAKEQFITEHSGVEKFLNIRNSVDFTLRTAPLIDH